VLDIYLSVRIHLTGNVGLFVTCTEMLTFCAGCKNNLDHFVLEFVVSPTYSGIQIIAKDSQSNLLRWM